VSPDGRVREQTGSSGERASHLPGRSASPDVTAVTLAARGFPAGLESPLPGNSSRQSTTSSFQRRLAEAIETGIDEREVLPGGEAAALVERVTFANGTEAVYKIVYTEAEIHAELLTSLVGRAIGARVPEVCQVGRRDIYLEFMPGRAAVDTLRTLKQALAYVQTWDGLLLGLLDAVTDNQDRNPGNWIISDGGTVAGIDHTATLSELGWPGPVPGTIEPGLGAARSPFTRRWFIDADDRTGPVWKDNVLHPADVDQWLTAVIALQPHFSERGFADEWETVVGRLRAIGFHAKGPQPWLTPPTRLNSLSPEPKATSSRRPGAR
jgi:hypothetical protein